MKIYTIVSQIQVIGYIWMPRVLAATTITLSSNDIENIRDENGRITRVGVELWLDTHTGDFSQILDFSVTIGDDEFDRSTHLECIRGGTRAIAFRDSTWSHEASEFMFTECMYGDCNEY